MVDQEKQQTKFADCYVLTNNRTKDFIYSFLETFIPNRQEYRNAYEVPQFSETPTHLFTSANELMEYLERNKKESHAIYWINNEPSSLREAMCLFMDDAQLILGLCCETLYPDTTIERYHLKHLMEFANSTDGLILYEEPAPRSSPELLYRAALPQKKDI